MIPPRKSVPPPRKPGNVVQLNRTFDDVDELENYLHQNWQNPAERPTIHRMWNRSVISVEVVFPEKQTKGKK